MVKDNYRRLLALILVVFAVTIAGGLEISRSRAQEPSPSSAQANQTINRVELHQALLDLTNPWTVMCIAAHPDDEDGTSLIVMRRKYGGHTVSLFSTFGEGGQNAIGPELYEELGAIRARETMAAAEIQGSEPYFLGLKDFGFSKSADEAFRVWGHDEALRRMVLEIRKLRPDVIITNHSATNNDHGHHQATARLELEAFDAAADSQRFPEQLKDGLTIWQVQRLFVRVGRSNQTLAETAPVVTIDPNELDPTRGKVYAEEALQALQQHATQGPWPKTFADMLRFRGSQDGKIPLTRYVLVREAKGASAVPPDSHNFIAGLKLPDSFATEVDLPMIDGKPLVEFENDRAKVLEQLLKHARKGFRFTSDWSNDERLSLMRNRIERATAIAAGIALQVETPDMIVTRNSNPEFKVRVSNAGTQTVSVFGCGSEIPTLTDRKDSKGGPTSIFETSEDLKSGSTLTRATHFLIPANAPINVPLARHLYEPTGLGLQVHTVCALAFGPGLNNRLSVEETTRVDVSFPIEVNNIEPTPLVMSPQTVNVPKSLTLQAINHRKTGVRTALEIFALNNQPDDAKDRKITQTPLLLAANDSRKVTITLPMMKSRTVRALKTITTNILTGETSTTISVPTPVAPAPKLLFRTTDNSSNEVEDPVVYANALVAPDLRVGYVRGFDYSLPNALAALGVESHELTVSEVETANLQKYSTIIVDNRVYESQPGLITANQKLLDYAKDGGTLIVFYHKSFEWNPDERRKRPQLAPYKLILGDERITDETAPISFIEPQHPLLNLPNKIGQEDFANWIQERGLYYPRDWDPQYHALLQSNDPGEAPLKGGLLVADYGRGHYIYTSMVWYRELRAGVPGAYRVFANMISYGHR
jgi:LmbE family N-acetylglucosaminyl deacetylase